MPTEKEKMLAGQVYNPGQDEDPGDGTDGLQGQVPPLQPIAGWSGKEGTLKGNPGPKRGKLSHRIQLLV